MKRNPLNTNQQIHNEPFFQGLPVIDHHGYLITSHLLRMHDCLTQSLDLHSRICMMRFDLYVPGHVFVDALRSNAIISKFIASLRAKIEHAQAQSRKEGCRIHDADPRFMWAREISSNGRVHFHVALVLNHAAFAFMGRFNLESRNMYARIHEAWASALGMYVGDVPGYVHIPEAPTYLIVRGDQASFNAAFYRISYFAKLGTKEYQQGFHTFGCSKNRPIVQDKLFRA